MGVFDTLTIYLHVQGPLRCSSVPHLMAIPGSCFQARVPLYSHWRPEASGQRGAWFWEGTRAWREKKEQFAETLSSFEKDRKLTWTPFFGLVGFHSSLVL